MQIATLARWFAEKDIISQQKPSEGRQLIQLTTSVKHYWSTIQCVLVISLFILFFRQQFGKNNKLANLLEKSWSGDGFYVDL